jgi:hypothetical protein
LIEAGRKRPAGPGLWPVAGRRSRLGNDLDDPEADVLNALFDRDFDRYFAEVGAGQPLWLFVHVPKTAGSSLTAEAEALLQPSFNIDIDHTDVSRTYQTKFDEAVQSFIASHATKRYRFCTGHINARHVDMIRRGVADLRCFSMLRNPIARIVSDYRYQRSAMNTARAHFVANTPTFETYVARPHVHNKIALNLAPRPMVLEGNVAGCVDHIMRNFDFIGLQEMYPLSLKALTTLMGETRAPEARVRVNESSADQVELNPELEKTLRELNAVDIGIFNAFLARYRDIRDDLRLYMRRFPVAETARSA